MCKCARYLLSALTCGDSSHISAVYWNITGTCLCPKVFNGYLRAHVGSLHPFIFPIKVLYKKDLFLFLQMLQFVERTDRLCWPECDVHSIERTHDLTARHSDQKIPNKMEERELYKPGL